MRESDTYMAIIDEGRETEAKRILFRLGEKRLGTAEETVRARIAAIQDIDRLEAFVENLDQVSSWQELLQLP